MKLSNDDLAKICPKISRWMVTHYSTTSTITLISILLDIQEKDSRHGMFDVPQDYADFANLYSLVRDVPEIKEYFDVVMFKYHPYSPCLVFFDHLEKVYTSTVLSELQMKIRIDNELTSLIGGGVDIERVSDDVFDITCQIKTVSGLKKRTVTIKLDW